MGRFDGKVAIITGASGGLGRATAILFVKGGARLTITGRNVQALQVTEEECLKAGAKEDDILTVVGDITNAETQDELISKTAEKFGHLDILVNNHGDIIKGMERDEHGNVLLELLDQTMDVNFRSKYVMALKAKDHLIKTKGCVVNLNSIAGKAPDPNFPLFTLASGALDSATKLLAYEYAKHQVRVNSVNPFVINSSNYAKFGLTNEQASQIMNAMVERAVPTKQLPQPAEVAELVAFLADGNASKHLTGEIIVPGGGVLLKLVATDYDFSELFKPAS